ncbi:hypothetical protein ACIOJD_12680 [Streptomyces sp. NPDC088116]|uniref:hypothetical protein n=1 Tax=Streptomyces sp. NPDC088116 TaxID=3365825 RepID=UPI0037F9B50D
MKNIRRALAVSAVGLISASTLALGAGTASASPEGPREPQEPRHFTSALACQTTGNTWAQQGKLTGFRCVQEGNSWALYTW